MMICLIKFLMLIIFVNRKNTAPSEGRRDGEHSKFDDEKFRLRNRDSHAAFQTGVLSVAYAGRRRETTGSGSGT